MIDSNYFNDPDDPYDDDDLSLIESIEHIKDTYSLTDSSISSISAGYYDDNGGQNQPNEFEILNRLDSILLNNDDQQIEDNLDDEQEQNERNDGNSDDTTISLTSNTSTIACSHLPLNMIDDRSNKLNTCKVSQIKLKDDSIIVKNGCFIRRIQRFSDGVSDNCRFPLSLPMDGSDIYRSNGNNHRSTSWQAIDMLADCVLLLWTQNADNTSGECPLNNVLNDSIEYLCLQPQLIDYLKYSSINLKHKSLPYRRHHSLIDFNDFNRQKHLLNFQLKYSNDNSSNDDDHGIILENFRRHSRTDCHRLISPSKLMNPGTNPAQLAQLITKIEKNYYQQLTTREILNLMFGNAKIKCNNSNLKAMLQFSIELTKLIECFIRGGGGEPQHSIEGRTHRIIYSIEIAFILLMRRNYLSFYSIMRGLCLPFVYSLRESWLSLKMNNPIHFRIYQQLINVHNKRLNKQKSLIIHHNQFVNGDLSLSSSLLPSLPALSMLIDTIKLRTIALICHLIENSKQTNEIHDNFQHKSIIQFSNQNQEPLNRNHRNKPRRKSLKIQFWPFKCHQNDKKIIKQDISDQMAVNAIETLRSILKSFDPTSMSDGSGKLESIDIDYFRLFIDQQFFNEQNFNHCSMPNNWQSISLMNINTYRYQLLIDQFIHLYRKLFKQHINDYKF